MFNPFRSSVRARVLSSRIGSLIMLFQRSPVIQMIFPEAKILGGAGLGEIAKWTVATVAGLGAYDSVAGATTIAQLAPNAGSTTVPATKGQALSFVFQLTNYSDTPGSWKVTGLPTGLTHTDAKNNSIDSVAGTPTQTGTFSVKITAYSKTTYSGDSFSRTFTMNVAADPSAAITTNPTSVTINSGQTTTLTVTASGTAPLTYQWYRGASGNTSNPVGTNSASFTTPALTATTTYWVKVSNSANPGGSNSSTATVTVNQPAAITSHPSSVTINSGSTTTLSASASGTAPLTYQWYRGAKGVTTAPVGTNSSSFTTPALTTTTSYWVKVTNVANAAGAQSNAATVTVNQPVVITTQPSAAVVVNGQTASLNVVASGTAPITYQWYEGTSGVTTTPVGTDSATFTTPALSASTQYWVKISNPVTVAGLNSNAASVTVIDPALITSHPGSVSIDSGGMAILSVAATGTGPFFYQWYEGESGVTTTPVGTDSSAFITPILTSTTRYWVLVMSEASPDGVASNTATVTVNDVPASIITQPASVVIANGQSTTLNVGAGGTGPLHYQWYEGNSGVTSIPVGTDSASFTTPALMATTSYWVNVSNAANPNGANSEAALVTVPVITPASIVTHPQSITINSGQSTSLTVVADGAAPLVYQWYEGAAGDTSKPVGSDSAEFVSPALTANTSYWVKVTNISNPGGADSDAALISVNQPAAITVQPASVGIYSGQTTTLTVEATGTGPLVYQWYQGPVGTKTNPVGTDLSSFTTPALSETTAYWVNVSNVANPQGVDSSEASVTVTPGAAVLISIPPASITLNRGESTTLSVTASGSPPLVYQWYQGVAGDTSNPVGTDLASYTTPALNVPTSYWVRVSNHMGPVDSDVAEIGILSMIAVRQGTTDLIDGASSRNFGNVAIGSTSPMSFTIRNAGTITLADLSISKSGTHPGDFLITGPIATELAGSEKTTFSVTFKPLAKGARSASIHIDTSVIGEESFDIQLDGSGTVPLPEIVVQQPSGSDLIDGTAKKSFGTVKVGKKGAVKTFYIRNSGNANLTGLSVLKDGKHAKDFTLTAPTATTIGGGKFTTFQVTFKPLKKGTHNAALHIKSNDANENPFDIQITGLGAP